MKSSNVCQKSLFKIIEFQFILKIDDILNTETLQVVSMWRFEYNICCMSQAQLIELLLRGAF